MEEEEPKLKFVPICSELSSDSPGSGDFPKVNGLLLTNGEVETAGNGSWN